MQTQAAAQLPGLLAHQAVDADYVGQPFQKGHLYSRNHNTNDVQVHATYTLTKAAPQRGADNKAWYHHMESKIIEYIDAACEDREAFIVTGVVPGNNYMHILAPGSKGRVNIPGYFWSAFCCEEAGNPGTFTSGGYTMQMGVGAQNADVHDVGNLNNLLTGYYNLPAGQNVRLFGQQAGCS
ncbi:endonuclease domain-containing 1 protein-like [Engraulis encrasicolus]|uniref:endonuclease domain-containing 1 protein-like n=1 Tax=Engraulis encrasicolus TaxID=184585 RepID=UPI002FCFA8D6